MQTGDCAGFGKQPNATARRLLSRALWVGGLAVAGSVFGAATASADEAERPDEPVERSDEQSGVLGTLTSAVEPVAGLSGSLAAGADTLLTEDLALSEDLLSNDSLVGEIELNTPVAQSEEESTGAVGLEEDRRSDQDARERAADRDAAIDTHTDRSMRRAPIEEATEAGTDSAETVTTDAPEPDPATLIGTVDRLLDTTVETVPDVTAVPAVGEVGGELTSGAATELLGEAVPEEDASAEPVVSTRATTDALGVVTGLVTLLDLPLADGPAVLRPLEPLLTTLDPVDHASAPAAASTGKTAGTAPRKKATRPASPTPITLDHASNPSADTAPRYSLDETGAARPAGQDGESAVIHSSLDAGTDGQDPFSGTRGGLRPSLLATPVAGLSVLHVGAPGAATSADQAGPSSHALLPEEAVLRARLFSAAAYARNVEVKPLREANDPPVTPD